MISFESSGILFQITLHPTWLQTEQNIFFEDDLDLYNGGYLFFNTFNTFLNNFGVTFFN